jgi:hypothetical protein
MSSSSSSSQGVVTAKEEMNNLMVEVFEMIENLNIKEGDYLIFAEKFKQMNINIGRLAEIKTVIVENVYYRRYIKRKTTVQQQRLTEEQKRRHPSYFQCNCGRFVHKNYEKEHLQTQVHYQGRRNRKYANTHLSDTKINECIDREVAIQSYIIKHLETIRQEKIKRANDLFATETTEEYNAVVEEAFANNPEVEV